MQTSGGNHMFLDHRSPAGDDMVMAGHATTPTAIVAGSRVTREFVRLLVAGAFFIVEAIFRLDEMRVIKAFHRKRGV